MTNMIIKTMIFIGVWLLSFSSAVYLYGAACMEYYMSGLDFILNFSGFILSILWLWSNTVKSTKACPGE
ncbi:MAG: hypothetical protein J6L70_01490 [Alphaproteobacteria bacterium]|nr:hypothetical protein [Alphaproteobacteria bacterium]